MPRVPRRVPGVPVRVPGVPRVEVRPGARVTVVSAGVVSAGVVPGVVPG